MSLHTASERQQKLYQQAADEMTQQDMVIRDEALNKMHRLENALLRIELPFADGNELHDLWTKYRAELQREHTLTSYSSLFKPRWDKATMTWSVESIREYENYLKKRLESLRGANLANELQIGENV